MADNIVERFKVSKGEDKTSSEDFDTEEDLSLVVSIILESDRIYVGGDDVSSLAREEYARHITSRKAGRKLRILGEEILEVDDFKTNYRMGGSTSKWNIKYLRDECSDELIELGKETAPKYFFDPEYSPELREVDTWNEDAIEAYKKDFPEFEELEELTPKSITKYLKENDPDIDRLNQFLLSQADDNPLQVSKISENSGGWAPDAVNPGQVIVHNEEIYGNYAILREEEKRSIPSYELLATI